MAGTALRSQWRCVHVGSGCTENGEGTGRQVDLAARKHEKTAGHATICWQEPELPLKVPDPTAAD